MTPLLAQFLTEAYDLVETANASLLQLERTPDDATAINGLFRAVHTLKGSAGLFDLPAFIQLVHAGEDLLSLVREGKVALTPEVVDALLGALDAVKSWLDALAATETLPPDAFDTSRTLATALRALIPSAGRGAGEAAAAGGHGAEGAVKDGAPEWLAALPETVRQDAFMAVSGTTAGAGRTLVAVDYTPDAQCFFSGEDPLHLIRQVPDLLALAVTPQAPWPPLADLDPYTCVLRFNLLSLAPRVEIEQVFRYVPDQVRVRAVPPEALIVPEGEPGDTPVFRDFVETASALAAARDVAGLLRTTQALLDLTSPTLRAASVLRWLLTVLAAPLPRPALVIGLIHAVGSAEPPRWDLAVPAPAPAPTPAPAPSSPPPAGATADEAVALALFDEQRRILDLPVEPALLGGRLASVGRTLANVLAATGGEAAAREAEAAAAAALAAGSPQPLLDLLRRLPGAAAAAPPDPSRTQTPHPAGARPAASPGGAAGGPAAGNGGAGGEAAGSGLARTLRVEQAKVDLLMNLIGELVVAKNGLPFLARRAEQMFGSREMARELKDQYGVFDRLAQEMQGAIMQIRMLPVAQMFQRFPRLVRDLARKLGKTIDLVIEGEETEADKNVIESLGDPLLHIVRNALDHGIEAPEERRAAGKPETATIRLKAYQESDNVVIEVSDDGRGIDPDRVRAKAVEKGLVTAEEAAALDDAAAVQLVFRPGFSTAETVTDLSGRGVGMDVVRAAVAKEGGRVTLASRRGQGTVVSLYLPLSMAVTRVMMVEAADRLFGIPMDIIAETVRVPRSRLRAIKRAETMVLRDAIVPVVRLRRLLGLDEDAGAREEEAILVVRLGDQPIGIVIDQFKEGIDIILKPLEGILADIAGYSGTAILGDGRVLLVLNLKALL